METEIHKSHVPLAPGNGLRGEEEIDFWLLAREEKQLALEKNGKFMSLF